jgi:hypothetical protein
MLYNTFSTCVQAIDRNMLYNPNIKKINQSGDHFACCTVNKRLGYGDDSFSGVHRAFLHWHSAFFLIRIKVKIGGSGSASIACERTARKVRKAFLRLA